MSIRHCRLFFFQLVTVSLAALPSGQLLYGQSTPRFASLAEFVQFMNATHPKVPLAEFVKYVNTTHPKVPFDRDAAELPLVGREELVREASAPKSAYTRLATHTNIKVNRDRDPWPKAEVAVAIDPTNGNDALVMSNDFRENFDHEFFHFSSNGGTFWSDDSLVGGSDPITGFVPLSFQSDPGVVIDSLGNSYLSDITENSIFDGNAGYLNLDAEIEVVQGFAHGQYALLSPTPVDVEQCSGTLGGTTPTFTCNATLDKPLIAVDNVPGSPHNGTVYVYYTFICMGTGPKGTGPCSDGPNVTGIPSGATVILEVHSPGAGVPFTNPALVSGALGNSTFADLVVDSHGTPHMFFDDFGNSPVANMWESTLSGGVWTLSKKPVATFLYNGLGNFNWGFRDTGAAAPGCGIHVDTAYCAFSANQVAGGPPEGSPSLYLAVVDTPAGTSTIHRVNNDLFGANKHHFFGWATAKEDGSVYVGWYDDRADPFDTDVQYFVGKSTDGGKTFPTQTAVNDVPFNPCVGFPGCGFFGDYTQIVAGPDGVVHAAWSDTRDGRSMQIWSQAITW